MTRYAAQTTVTPERSRYEIECILKRYGCDGFAYGWDGLDAVLQFRANGRMVRFVLHAPREEDFVKTATGRRRLNRAKIVKATEQGDRQRWRALALVIKAKLEAVETGIVTFEDEFLAHTVLPNQRTVGEWIHPQVEAAYRTGVMPTMLPAIAGANGGG